jgi:hypothetical protein
MDASIMLLLNSFCMHINEQKLRFSGSKMIGGVVQGGERRKRGDM